MWRRCAPDRRGSRDRPETFSRGRPAGTVDIGAIDDLQALSALCLEEKLWFHVDGAYGALGVLSPALAPRLAGLENADSIALDFHNGDRCPMTPAS